MTAVPLSTCVLDSTDSTAFVELDTASNALNNNNIALGHWRRSTLAWLQCLQHSIHENKKITEAQPASFPPVSSPPSKAHLIGFVGTPFAHATGDLSPRTPAAYILA
jgi:hypothetical protein